MPKLIIIFAILVLCCWYSYVNDLPKKYRIRNCMGTKWKKRFPNTPAKDIRDFLSLFANAFAIADKHKLKFEPEDKILDIYQSFYPIILLPDVLELETLALEIESNYKINLTNIWHENITLAELFNKASVQPQQQTYLSIPKY